MLCRLIWKHRVSWKKLGIIKYKGWSGYLNSVQGLYENSIDNFKHSIRYYELASDRRRILYGYRNMARGYFSVHHNDSAGWYAEKGLVLSDTVSGMKASFLHL